MAFFCACPSSLFKICNSHFGGKKGIVKGALPFFVNVAVLEIPEVRSRE